jgi:hypothetical protein
MMARRSWLLLENGMVVALLAFMLRWIGGGVVLALVAGSFSACSIPGDCPELPPPHCWGDTIVYLSRANSDDCGIYDSTYVDCTESGARCENAQCVRDPPKNPCPEGNGECRGNVAFTCTFGGLPDEGEDCAAQGLDCIEYPVRAGRVNATCALSSTPCESDETEERSECQDNQVVTCRNGFPVGVATCVGDGMRCVDYPSSSSLYGDSARCTYSVACPPPRTTFCHENVILGCNGGETTVEFDRCEVSCLESSGQAYCANESSVPALRFIPIPGGIFRPQAGMAQVTVGDFAMMEREVSVREYAACVAAGDCPERDRACVTSYADRPRLHADSPVTCVDFSSAQAFCATVDGRPPTVLEWKYALSNALPEYQFPCAADRVPCERLRSFQFTCGQGESSCLSSDVTTQGVCDLLGNVSEIVEHEFGSGVPARCGGAYGCGGTIDMLEPEQVGEDLPQSTKGFRCVR